MKNDFIGNMTDTELVEWFKNLPKEELKIINDQMIISKQTSNVRNLLKDIEKDFYCSLYKTTNEKYEVDLSFGTISENGLYIQGNDHHGSINLSCYELKQFIDISKELQKLNKSLWED